MRGKGRGGGGTTRGDWKTSQGKLEVNGRWEPKGLTDKDDNNKALQTGRKLSANAIELVKQDNKGNMGDGG